MEEMMVSKIQTRSPFKDLFVINSVVLKAIEEDMGKYGFDESAPIVLWKEGNVVIDGHTRLQAAKNIGLKKVFVSVGDFDEEGAIKYAIHNQRDRRNITDAEILKCVEAVDKRRATGRHKGSEKNVSDINNISSQGCKKNVSDINNISSHLQTAMSVGISPSKVQEVRTILNSEDEGIKQEVLEGKKSIHAASKEIVKGRVKEPLLVAYKELEKGMKKVIDKAVREGIKIEQIERIVKELLKAHYNNKDTTGELR